MSGPVADPFDPSPEVEYPPCARTGDPIIDLNAVRLRYRLAKQRIPSFKEYAIHWMKGSLHYEDLWALKGVTLDICAGESVGFVGRNGAGKSTLLKVICGVLKPTDGTCKVTGTVAPILELGTGFDYELTGAENIFLNALLLGHSTASIRPKIEEIVEFSGLEEFIDAPIRNYSSGMIARLGFSIATAWRPDILILDEVLAVGDHRFRQRCEERMASLVDGGTTVLYVSHNASSVVEICERAIWLEEGNVMADGPVSEIIAQYEQFASSGS